MTRRMHGRKRVVTVTDWSRQTTETRSRWSWAEPSVWTDRMLAALEKGVKGGKWFSLIDKVFSTANLESAWRRVAGNRGAPGVDRITVSDYDRHLEHNTARLQEALRTDVYQPLPNRRTWIGKPGSQEKRPLGIPTVRDRHAQCALKQVLEPIFERDFAEHSYGFRPERSCKDALRVVQTAMEEGWLQVIDADLKSYFDTIPHSPLVKRVAEKVSDGRVLGLIEKFLKQGVMDGLTLWTPEKGTPQGAVISPLLSNIYLDPLDHLMAARGWRMVRYADDFVILCRTAEESREAMEALRQWVHDNGLALHPEKTRMVDMNEAGNGFDFLGYRFQTSRRTGEVRHWPAQKSIRKFKDKIRAHTHRCNGHGLPEIISRVNATVRGWFGYFKHSNRPTYDPLDGWIRMRLRSILRRRYGLRGCGRGRDHNRWTNAYFRQLGLFSLDDAFVEQCQSLRSNC